MVIPQFPLPPHAFLLRKAGRMSHSNTEPTRPFLSRGRVSNVRHVITSTTRIGDRLTDPALSLPQSRFFRRARGQGAWEREIQARTMGQVKREVLSASLGGFKSQPPDARRLYPQAGSCGFLMGPSPPLSDKFRSRLPIRWKCTCECVTWVTAGKTLLSTADGGMCCICCFCQGKHHVLDASLCRTAESDSLPCLRGIMCCGMQCFTRLFSND